MHTATGSPANLPDVLGRTWTSGHSRRWVGRGLTEVDAVEAVGEGGVHNGGDERIGVREELEQPRLERALRIPEVIRAIWCSWMRVVPQSEVI